MKLTYEDKVQIYELRKQGYSLEKLSNKFGITNLIFDSWLNLFVVSEKGF